MKDKKIRILCIVVAALSIVAIVPVMFEFYEYYVTDYYGEVYNYYSIYGISLYSGEWYFILVGVLGITSLLWNLVYGAYAIIDGRYRNLTWRIARYGYFFGLVTGIINFALILSNACNAAPAAWSFVVLIAAVIAVEIVLIILRDEDTKNKLQNK